MRIPIALFTLKLAKKLFSQMNSVPKVMTEESERMSLELKNTGLHEIFDAINVGPIKSISIFKQLEIYSAEVKIIFNKPKLYSRVGFNSINKS